MVIDQSFIDALRAAHLVCFAAGMGTAVYFDFRTFMTLGAPVTRHDIEAVHSIHMWITWAFLGLWVTGAGLIYVRTSFDLAAFSPKLWLKLGLMVLMVLNARLIAVLVIPILRKSMGRALVTLSERDLVVATQIAATSMFCWTSGLVLGSSVQLKTASWDLLMPLALGWFLLLTVVSQLAIILVRQALLPRFQDTDQLNMKFE